MGPSGGGGGGGAGGGGGGSRQEPAGITRAFFCPLVRHLDTWGQHGPDGFRLTAASDADARRRRRGREERALN